MLTRHGLNQAAIVKYRAEQMFTWDTTRMRGHNVNETGDDVMLGYRPE